MSLLDRINELSDEALGQPAPAEERAPTMRELRSGKRALITPGEDAAIRRQENNPEAKSSNLKAIDVELRRKDTTAKKSAILTAERSRVAGEAEENDPTYGVPLIRTGGGTLLDRINAISDETAQEAPAAPLVAEPTMLDRINAASEEALKKTEPPRMPPAGQAEPSAEELERAARPALPTMSRRGQPRVQGITYPEPQPVDETKGEYRKALESGAIGGNHQIVGDASEGIGILTGSKNLEQWGGEVSAKGAEYQKGLEPKAGSLKDVVKDPSKWLDYIKASAGSAMGTSLPTILPGLAVAAVTGNPIASAIIGSAGPALVFNYGDVYGSAKRDKEIEQLVKDGKLTKYDVALVSLGFSIPVAALDTAAVAKLAQIAGIGAAAEKGAITQIARSAAKEYLLTVAKAGGKGATWEGITEAVQAAISIWARKTLGANPSLADMAYEIADNFVGGALTGGTMSAGGRAATTPMTEKDRAAQQISEAVEGRDFSKEGNRQAAVAALSPENAQMERVTPEQQAERQQRRPAVAQPPGGEEPPPGGGAAEFTPTNKLDDGTLVRPQIEGGKPVEGAWVDEDGRRLFAPRADPIQTPESNATMVVGNVPYDVAVIGKGREKDTARLADGQEVQITKLDLGDPAKELLGLLPPEEKKTEKKPEPEPAPSQPAAAPAAAASQPAAPSLKPAPVAVAATPAVPPPAGPKPQTEKVNATEIQNRQRAGNVVSDEQIRRIGKNPDYTQAGYSNSPESGAPLASYQAKHEIPENQIGRKGVVVIGDQKVPVQYAVVDAEDVTASVFRDGRARPAYFQAAQEGELRALSNGRTAGLQRAYAEGNADTYKAELAADDLHGISADVIKGMKRPMLIRLYDSEWNAKIKNIGKASQGKGLGRSPLEVAIEDAANLTDEDMALFAPTESGDFQSASNLPFMNKFLGGLTLEERGTLVEQESGEPNADAYARARSAVFQRAYQSPFLTGMFAEKADSEAGNTIRALTLAAGEMGKLIGAPEEVDVRTYVSEAAKLVIMARRQNMSLASYLKEGSLLERNASVEEIAKLFAEHNRSPRLLGEALKAMARFSLWAWGESVNGSVFGDPVSYDMTNVVRAGQKFVEEGYAKRGEDAEGAEGKVAQKEPVYRVRGKGAAAGDQQGAARANAAAAGKAGADTGAEAAARGAAPAETVKGEERATEDSLQGKSAETAIPSVGAAVKLLVAGKLKPIPNRDGQCYRWAGKAALAGKGNFVIGVLEQGVVADRLIWHGVTMNREGLVYDAVLGVWFGKGVLEGLNGWTPVHVMTGAEVGVWGVKNGMWPSPPLLGLRGGDKTHPKLADVDPFEGDPGEGHVAREKVAGYTVRPWGGKFSLRLEGDVSKKGVIQRFDTEDEAWTEAAKLSLAAAEKGAAPRLPSIDVDRDANPQKVDRWEDIKWAEMMDYFAANVNNRRVIIIKPSEVRQERYAVERPHYRAIVSGSFGQLDNEGVAPTLDEAARIAFEGLNRPPTLQEFSQAEELIEEFQWKTKKAAYLWFIDTGEHGLTHFAQAARELKTILDDNTALPSYIQQVLNRGEDILGQPEVDDDVLEQRRARYGSDFSESAMVAMQAKRRYDKHNVDKQAIAAAEAVMRSKATDGTFKELRWRIERPGPDALYDITKPAVVIENIEAVEERKGAGRALLNRIKETGLDVIPEDLDEVSYPFWEKMAAEGLANGDFFLEQKQDAASVFADVTEAIGKDRGDAYPLDNSDIAKFTGLLQKNGWAAEKVGKNINWKKDGWMLFLRTQGPDASTIVQWQAELPEIAAEFRISEQESTELMKASSVVQFSEKKPVKAVQFRGKLVTMVAGFYHHARVGHMLAELVPVALWKDAITPNARGYTGVPVKFRGKDYVARVIGEFVYDGAEKSPSAAELVDREADERGWGERPMEELELAAQTEADLVEKEKQAKKGKIEEVTTKVGDVLALTPPPSEDKKVEPTGPTGGQMSLFQPPASYTVTPAGWSFTRAESPEKWFEQLRRERGDRWMDVAAATLDELERSIGERPGATEPAMANRRESFAWISEARSKLHFAQVEKAAADAQGHNATPAQQKAGNYEMGHVDNVGGSGLDATIENAAGTKRRPDWPTLKYPYGYFKGTVGFDNGHLDAFFGDGPNVYVVNQNKSDGRFDEHKVMFGFNSIAEAHEAYLSNYTPGWDRGRTIIPFGETRSPAFKAWATDTSAAGPRGGRLLLSHARSIEEVFAAQGPVSGAEGAPGVSRAAAPERNIYTTSPIPGSTAVLPEVVVVEAKEIRRFALPEGRISGPVQAAQAFSQMTKSPRELFQMIALDADGRPIAAYELFAGTLTQTSVYPREVATVVHMTPGVASIWMAHNHPSGEATPSEADVALTRRLADAGFTQTGVDLKGHLVMAGNEARVLDASGEAGPAFTVPPSTATTTVPVMERVVKFQGQAGMDLTSAEAAREFFKGFAPQEKGLVILDARHRVIGWWPMTRFRSGAAVDLLRAIGRNNPAAAIYYSPDTSPEGISHAKEVATVLRAAMAKLDVKVLDAFVQRADNNPTSLAEMGAMDVRAEYKVSEGPMPFFSLVPTLYGLATRNNGWARAEKYVENMLKNPYQSVVENLGVKNPRTIALAKELDELSNRHNEIMEQKFQMLRDHAENGYTGSPTDVKALDAFNAERERDKDLWDAMSKEQRAVEDKLDAMEYEFVPLIRYHMPKYKGRPRYADMRRGIYPSLGTLTGSSVAQIKAALANNPIAQSLGENLEVVESPHLLPKWVVDAAVKRDVLGKIQGLYDPFTGKTYIVASHTSAAGAPRVLLHEAVGHMGIFRVLPAAAKKNLTDAMVDVFNARRGSIMTSPELKAYGFNFKDRAHQASAAAEWIALKAERGEEQTLWQKVVAAIRAALRSIPGVERYMGWSDNDILRLLQKSREALPRKRTLEEARGEIMLSLGGQPLWYSALVKGIEDKGPGRALPKEWMTFINNLPRVKSEEIAWSGIEDWLNQAVGRPSKNAVLEFLAQSGVRVEEKILGEPAEPKPIDRAFAPSIHATVDGGATPQEHLTNLRSAANNLVVELDALGYDIEEDPDGNVDAVVYRGDRESPRTRYMSADDYVAGEPLDPAVRERVRSLQEIKDRIDELEGGAPLVVGTDTPGGSGKETRYGTSNYVLPGGAEHREIVLSVPNALPWGGEDRAHYGDLTGQRGTGWIRANTRLDAQGNRWFFIEELQNKRAEAARRKNAKGEVVGFETKEVAAKDAEVRALIDQLRAEGTTEAQRAEYFTPGRIVPSYGGFDRVIRYHPERQLGPVMGQDGRWRSWSVEVRSVQSSWSWASEVQAVMARGMGARGALAALQDPAAWQDVPGERVRNHSTDPADEIMRRLEAEHPGATRYSMRPVPPMPFAAKTEAWTALLVNRAIRYAVDNGFHGVAWTTGAQQNKRYSLSTYADELRVNFMDGLYNISAHHGGTFRRSTKVSANDLPDWVGADLAKRIIAGEREFTSQDLEFGGHGMREYYDQMVPNIVNDQLRRLGAGTRVTQIKLVMPYKSTADRNQAINTYREQMLAQYGDGIMLPGRMTQEQIDHLHDLEDGDLSAPTQPGFVITEALKKTGAGPMPIMMLRPNPGSQGPSTMYGLTPNGDLRGIARRQSVGGPWDVRTTTGQATDLLKRGAHRASQAATQDEAERTLNAAGLSMTPYTGPSLSLADRAVLESQGRAFDLSDKDVTSWGNRLVHPRTRASFEPDFTPVALTGEKQFEERDYIVSELHNEMKSLAELSNGEKRNVFAVAELGRLQKTTFGRGPAAVVATNSAHPDAVLSKPGDTITLTDKEKAGYWALRRTMDKALNFLRNQVIREHGLDPVAIRTPEQVLASIPAGAPVTRKNELKRLADNVRELLEMRRTGYIPFSRWGDYAIVVKDAQGKVVRYELVEWAPGAAAKEAAKLRAPGTIPVAQTRAEQLREQYPNHTVLGPMHVSHAQGAGFVDLGMLDQLARMAMVDRAQYEVMREQLSEAQKKRGFRAHLTTSNDIPGYSDQFERAIADYSIGVASYLARRRYRQDWQDAIGQIPGHKPNLRQYAEDYYRYADTPHDEFQGLRQAAYVYYIAGVPMTAFVNLTQPFLTTLPVLSMFNPIMATVEVARAYAETLAMVAPLRSVLPGNLGQPRTGMGLLKPNEFFNPAYAPADVRDALTYAWEKGIMAPMTTMEMLGLARNRAEAMRKLDRQVRLGIEFTAHMFMTAERMNRLASFIAAHRIASKPGAKEMILSKLAKNALAQASLREARDFAGAFAEWVVDETQFRTGKVNRTEMQRGLGTALLQFKDYSWQMIELQARMAMLAGPSGKMALVMMLSMLAIGAGWRGLPFADTFRLLAEGLMKFFTEKDFDLALKIREAMIELTGSKKIAEMTANGVFRGIDKGPEVSGRIGLGTILPDPTRPMSFIGVPGDLLYQRGVNAATWARRGETELAGAAVLPNFLKNIVEAEQWKHGIRSAQTGSKIVHEQDIAQGDIWLKYLGARSSKISEMTESEYAQNRASHALDEMRRNLTYRIGVNLARVRSAREAGDPDAEAQAQAKVTEAYEFIRGYNIDRPIHEQIGHFDPKTKGWQAGPSAAALEEIVAREIVGTKMRDLRAPKAQRSRRQEIEEVYTPD